MKKIYKIARFVLPVVLLSFIVTQINFTQLSKVFEKSDKFLLVLTFISFPLSYVLFTLRWKLVLNMFGKKDISFLRLLKTIYIGIFAGFFIPSAVGIDIYRVVNLRKTDSTHINLGLIFQEKLMGLLICGFFILLFSSFLNIDENGIFPFIRDVLYYILMISLILLSILLIFKSTKTVQLVLSYIEKRLMQLIDWFLLKFKKKVHLEEGFLNKVLQVSLYPKMILIVVLFSMLNQTIAAVFSNIAFKAMGADLSLVSNLFANPLMNIIFLFPISFGGFGIREGSYILIFGFLGVSNEISLLVSFIFMVSAFINIGIGGIVFMLDKKEIT